MTRGQKIKKLRMDMGYSQEELGKIIGVSFGTISKYENDVIEIPSDNLKKIAKVLNVSTDYLLGISQDKPHNTYNENECITDTVEIPILGKISAGLPLMAVENIEGTYKYPKAFLNSSNEYFFLRIKGDSMNLRCPNGSLVLFQKQNTLENGEIGAILVNGDDATIKRFRSENQFIILEPMSSNTEYRTQIYDSTKTSISIIGKAISSTIDM